MKSPATIIVICPLTGARLCRDFKWRLFAHFGNTSRCVKEYKLTGPALKAGAKHRIEPARRNDIIAKVTHLNPGDEMDARGIITRGTYKSLTKQYLTSAPE